MNKWLMGALMVLTMGVVSSCKDYDDDINANTLSIEGLQDQVKALEAAKNTAASDLAKANEAITTAQAAATKAQNAADLAQELVEAANKRIADAEAAVKAAQSAAENAQATGDNALAQAQAALTAAEQARQDAQNKLDAAVAEVKLYAAQIAASEASAAAAKAKKEMLDELLAKEAALNAAIADKVSTEEFNKIVAGLATIESLNAALAPVNDQIADLVAQLQANSDAIKANSANISNNSTAIAANADAIKANAALIEAIQSKLDEIFNDAVRKADFETAIATLNAAIVGVTGDIAAVQKELKDLIDTKVADVQSSLSAEIAQLAATIQTLTQEKVNQSVVDELNARVTNLEASIATLNNYYLKSEVDALLAALASNTDIDSKIAAINAILDELKAKENEDITALQGQINTIAGDNATLKSDIATLKTLIETLQADLTAVKNAAATAATEENLAKVQADILALQNASANYASKTELNDVKAALEATIAALEQKANEELTKKIGDLTKLIGTNSEKIAQIEETIKAISTIQTDYTALEKRVGDNETAIGKNTEDIEKINSQLTGLNAALAEIVAELAGLENLTEAAQARANEGAATTLANVLKSMMNEIATLNAAVYAMQETVNQNFLFLTKKLTSLVFKPEGENAYLYSFPTIKAILFQAAQTYTFAYDKAADADAKTEGAGASKQLDVTAKYWLNPSTTDINDYNWGFDEVPSKNIITRSNHDAEKAGAKVTKIKAEKGIATVTIGFDNANNVNNAQVATYQNWNLGGVETGWPYEAWITTVALQASKKNGETKDSITSDYAIIVPDYCTNIVLANDFFKPGATDPAPWHVEGNRKWHLRTNYEALKTENATPRYSYELPYTTLDGQAEQYVDLKQITLHYNETTTAFAEKSHQDALDAGFTFKYTLLGADADVACFNLDTENETITVGKNEISSVGKHVNVRVELVIDGKTYAYGYLSIVIINNKQQVDITLPTLTLACPADFKTSITWAEFLAALKAKAGETFDLTKYTIDGVETDFTQYDTAALTLADITAKNVIGKDGDKFSWIFDVTGAKAMFYDANEEPNAAQEYVTYLHLTPLAAYPELAELIVKVTIPAVSYPKGIFDFTDRIKNYWFYDPLVGDPTKNADDVLDRHEIHANVEVVGQTNNPIATLPGVTGITAPADDEFVFDVTNSFYNGKFNKNAFIINDNGGFAFGDAFNREANLYFDASKYYIYNTADQTKKISTVIADKLATTTALGADNKTYVLFLTSPKSLYLQAFELTNGNVPALDAVDADGNKLVQDVVILSGDNNKVGNFQGFNDESYTIARNLLNVAPHYELGAAAGQTFTTHMLLAEADYCLPIALENNKFDIRYLRPVSGNIESPRPVIDAVDGGSKIYLADIVSFIDWRSYAFDQSVRWSYINYYGIKAIKANLETAETDVNGAFDLLSHYPGLRFNDDHTAVKMGTVPTRTKGVDLWASWSQFKTAQGYIEYQNNGLNVTEFNVKLYVSIIYDWGETKPVPITVTIKKTEGQEIEVRQK